MQEALYEGICGRFFQRNKDHPVSDVAGNRSLCAEIFFALKVSDISDNAAW